MKNILLIILFLTGLLLTYCVESNPQPICEEGGVEVTP